MEGLRGIAALMVLLVHFHTLFAEFTSADSWIFPVSLFLSSIGHTGVDLFFVLSGYLMYGVMLKKDFRYLPYLYRRAKRLYPVFLAVFTIYVFLSYQFPQKSKLPDHASDLMVYLGANLLMLPGIFPIVPMITAAWSLSYEWCFYITGPLMVLVFGLRNWSWRGRVLALLGFTILYLSFCYLGYIAHPRLAMFLAGCLLWECVKSGLLAGFLSPWGEWIAITAFLLSLTQIGSMVALPGKPMAVFAVGPGSYTGLLFITSFWFVGYALFHPGWLARLCSVDPLRWTGNISYSYYLAHGMVLHGIQMAVRMILHAVPVPPSPGLYALLFLVALCGTLVVGAVFYLLFERPFLHPAAVHAPPPRPASAPATDTIAHY